VWVLPHQLLLRSGPVARNDIDKYVAANITLHGRIGSDFGVRRSASEGAVENVAAESSFGLSVAPVA